jgi:uncharacterized membrane protein YqjE
VSSSPAGLFASLRGFAATSVAVLRTRLELLRLEAREEVGRLVGLVAWAVAAVLLGIVGTTYFAVFLTVLLWETHRMLALGVFAALFLGAAIGAIMVATRLARRESQLFAASLAELRRDGDLLRDDPLR